MGMSTTRPLFNPYDMMAAHRAAVNVSLKPNDLDPDLEALEALRDATVDLLILLHTAMPPCDVRETCQRLADLWAARPNAEAYAEACEERGEARGVAETLEQMLDWLRAWDEDVAPKRAVDCLAGKADEDLFKDDVFGMIMSAYERGRDAGYTEGRDDVLEEIRGGRVDGFAAVGEGS
jgi:hypothetical protein